MTTSTDTNEAAHQLAGPPVQYVTIDGLQTAYQRCGEGPVLVYLHDEVLSDPWLPLHDLLAQSFDVIVPQHPGFGRTPMPPGLRDFTDWVIHYAEFFDVLGVDQIHLVGSSLGGWAAAEFAVFYPRRCASLMLIGPLGIRVPGVTVGDQFRMSLGQREAVMLGEKGTELGSQLPFVRTDVDSAVRAYEESIAFARLAWNPRYDIRLETRLGRMEAPALVIHPAEDELVPLEHSQRYADLLPHGDLVIVEGPDAHHLVVLEQPQQLVAHLIELSRRAPRAFHAVANPAAASSHDSPSEKGVTA